jgi:branched-subunit amino acid aminotransferase/4-amino-4-deoxychorismate lyase
MEGLFTERELREKGLSPSHYANVLHYARSGFEGCRADVDRSDHVLYGIGLQANAERFQKTLDHLNIIKPATFGAVREQFMQRHADVVAELRRRNNPIEEPLLDARFLEMMPEFFVERVIETIVANYESGALASLHTEPHFCYIRPIAYRGDLRHGSEVVDSLGVFGLRHEPVFEISVRASKPYIKGNPKLVVSPEGIIGPHLNYKLGINYVPYGRGKDEAIYNGFTEVLFTTPRADKPFVAFAQRIRDPLINEGGGENFFAYTEDGKIVTPPAESGRILPGTKRALAIEIARNLGMTVVEDEVPLRELSSLKGVFLTGTWAGLEQVEVIFDPVTDTVVLYQPGSIEALNILQAEYQAVIKGGKLAARANEDVRRRIRTPILTLVI